MKNLSTLTLTILLITFSYLASVGQSSYDNFGATAYIDFEKHARSISFEIKETKNPFNNKKTKKGKDIYYDISDIDMSTSIDFNSNTLDFSGGDNIKYSKLQLTNKQSNETIISRKIDFDFKIDLNKIAPGTYFLILSNEKGDVKTEEISIF